MHICSPHAISNYVTYPSTKILSIFNGGGDISSFFNLSFTWIENKNEKYENFLFKIRKRLIVCEKVIGSNFFLKKRIKFFNPNFLQLRGHSPTNHL